MGENGGIALTSDRRNYRIPDITVVHAGAEGYDEVAVVRPGETWQTAEPFALRLDPADFV